jgi:methanogenic corrinoid protein MtbC1
MNVSSHALNRAEAALLDLDLEALRTLVAEVLATTPKLEVFETLVEPALERIGRSWEEGDLALAQVYMASRLVERLVEEHLVAGQLAHRSQPPIAMAVLEDHHILGKRLVLASLRMGGWAVADWGVAGDPVLLAERAHAEGLGILLISTLMDRSARRVAEVVRRLKFLGASTRVVVGGAPFRLNPELCREVGADATTAEASAVPALLESLVGAP